VSPFPSSHYIPSQTFWANRYSPSVLFPRRYKVVVKLVDKFTAWTVKDPPWLCDTGPPTGSISVTDPEAYFFGTVGDLGSKHLYYEISFSGDFEVEVYLKVDGPADGWHSVRVMKDQNNGYAFAHNTQNTAYIFRFDGCTLTMLGSTTVSDIRGDGLYHKLYGLREGDGIKFYLDDSLILDLTDATFKDFTIVNHRMADGSTAYAQDSRFKDFSLRAPPACPTSSPKPILPNRFFMAPVVGTGKVIMKGGREFIDSLRPKFADMLIGKARTGWVAKYFGEQCLVRVFSEDESLLAEIERISGVKRVDEQEAYKLIDRKHFHAYPP